MSSKTIRVALIGVGSVCAQVHYPGLSRIPGVEIVGISDPDASLLEKRSREWRVAACFGDVDDLLRKIQPDAVVIATPNCTHKSLILKAFAAGSHVLCEKPLGMNLAETKEILATAQKTTLRHMTAFTYRFVPAMNYLRYLVHTGALGEIRHARFQRLQDWGERAIGWRQYYEQAGSGELGDMGIHRIDFAEDLLGHIASLCAHTKQWAVRDLTKSGEPCLPQDVEDWVAWIAQFENGTTGVFEMGKLTKGFGPRGDHDQAELNGTKASAVYQLHNPHQILFSNRGESYQIRPVPAEFLKRSDSPREPNEGDPLIRFRYDQACEFISAIREGRECTPSFYHGMRAQAVADAILEAADSRKWIDVKV